MSVSVSVVCFFDFLTFDRMTLLPSSTCYSAKVYVLP